MIAPNSCLRNMSLAGFGQEKSHFASEVANYITIIYLLLSVDNIGHIYASGVGFICGIIFAVMHGDDLVR